MNKKIQILSLIWKEGFSQTTLAKILGCSEARLSRILNSHVLPTEDEIEAISSALKTDRSKISKILTGVN